MPLSDHALGDLGFAVGNNGSTGQQTSLDNCAAGDQTEVRMSEFTVNSIDTISGSSSVEVNTSETYEQTFSVEGSKFSKIKTLNQNFTWNTDDSALSVSSGDYDTTATGQSEKSGVTLTCVFNDEYNTPFNSENKTVDVVPQLVVSSFNYSVSAGKGFYDGSWNTTDANYDWEIFNISQRTTITSGTTSLTSISGSVQDSISSSGDNIRFSVTDANGSTDTLDTNL